VDFHSGTLADDGAGAYITARWQSFDVAFSAARNLVEATPALRRIDSRWGRNSVQVRITQQLWPGIERACARTLLARILAQRADVRPVLVQMDPAPRRAAARDAMSNGVTTVWYRSGSGPAAAFGLTITWLLGLWRQLRSRFDDKSPTDRDPRGGGTEGRTAPPRRQAPGTRAVLIVQEDSISDDRTHRSQPHWWNPRRADFDCVVLETSGLTATDLATRNRLAAMRIYLTKRNRWRICETLSAQDAAVSRALLADLLRSGLRLALCRSRSSFTIWYRLCGLLARALSLAHVCREHNVHCFVASEHYLLDVCAMQLIAPALGIRTISFQYSNVARLSPPMATTADLMMTFSDSYHYIWEGRVRPGALEAIGYLYGDRIELVRSRATATRQRMREEGARFTVCYLDENFNEGKYGLTSRQDHVDDLRLLLRWILAREDRGLVLKPQFRRHSLASFAELAPLVEAAEQTGRCIELNHGTHRNDVLPAEASLVADFTIGNLLGGTAGLESAIAGSKVLLVNRHGYKGHIEKFHGQDIVYASLAAAVRAIDEHRGAAASHPLLGDWRETLPQFDATVDGKAAQRLFEAVRASMLKPSSTVRP